ncbi:catalase, partial [Staphylococcus cohnii]|uniref:catalase n=1 Tax=Staphylococcus cohnii TaxID=29382 RepID=UPI0011A55D8A
NENTLTLPQPAPTLLQHFHFTQKIIHFHHQPIPQPLLHPPPFPPHGEFQVYEHLSKYTSPHFLTHPHKTTPLFLTFSTL